MSPARPHSDAIRDYMSSNVDSAELRERRARGYEGPRPVVQEMVPRSAKKILELGCSTGALGAAVKRRNGAFIFGVEIDADFVREAQMRLDKVVAADAEQFVRGPRPEEAPFDCLIGADVFEHLVDPWTTLDLAVALLGPGPRSS
jgi:predicted TPR repeat methyltransferase